MAVTKPRSEWTAEDHREQTEDARRAARFRYAQERAEKIARGEPMLTEQQIEELVQILRGGSDAEGR